MQTIESHIVQKHEPLMISFGQEEIKDPQNYGSSKLIPLTICRGSSDSCRSRERLDLNICRVLGFLGYGWWGHDCHVAETSPDNSTAWYRMALLCRSSCSTIGRCPFRCTCVTRVVRHSMCSAWLQMCYLPPSKNVLMFNSQISKTACTLHCPLR